MKEDHQSPNSQQRTNKHTELRNDDENVQTLTDLFDQLDRAAFKRVLEYRDATMPAKPAAKAGNG